MAPNDGRGARPHPIYLQNGGTFGYAQQIAAQELRPAPRRTQDEISLDEVERIRI